MVRLLIASYAKTAGMCIISFRDSVNNSRASAEAYVVRRRAFRCAVDDSHWAESLSRAVLFV